MLRYLSIILQWLLAKVSFHPHGSLFGFSSEQLYAKLIGRMDATKVHAEMLAFFCKLRA